MAIVIVKNNTASTVEVPDLGISLAAIETINFTNFFKFFELVASNDLKVLVSNGTVTINNGTEDLNIGDALNLLNVESEYDDLIQDAGSGVALTALPYCGVIRSTIIRIPNVWTNIIYESLQLQNYTNVLEWLVGSPDIITVKQDGLYSIFATTYMRTNTPTNANSYYRVVRNGVPISAESRVYTYNLQILQEVINFSVYLAAGDVISVQQRCDGTDNVDLVQSLFNIQRVEGIEGVAGPPGGTTIVTQDEGVQVTTNTAILNFQGTGVAVTDAGGNKANITINDSFASSGIGSAIQIYDSIGNVQVNVYTPLAYTFNSQDIRDTSVFNWSSVTDPSRIYVLRSGWYELSYNLNFFGDNAVKTIACYVRENGTTNVARTRFYGNTFRNNDPWGSVSSNVLIELHVGDYVEMMVVAVGSAGLAYTQPGETWMSLKFFRSI